VIREFLRPIHRSRLTKELRSSQLLISTATLMALLQPLGNTNSESKITRKRYRAEHSFAAVFARAVAVLESCCKTVEECVTANRPVGIFRQKARLADLVHCQELAHPIRKGRDKKSFAIGPTRPGLQPSVRRNGMDRLELLAGQVQNAHAVAVIVYHRNSACFRRQTPARKISSRLYLPYFLEPSSHWVKNRENLLFSGNFREDAKAGPEKAQSKILQDSHVELISVFRKGKFLAIG
jgi:hypothetical protein